MEEVDKLSKQRYLIELEQEFDDAYQSGDSRRIAAVELKRANLTNPELFAIGILIEDRLKKPSKKWKVTIKTQQGIATPQKYRPGSR